ncbi:MAG: hypothetical protein AAF645_05345 [Myxococcota bacterium]
MLRRLPLLVALLGLGACDSTTVGPVPDGGMGSDLGGGTIVEDGATIEFTRSRVTMSEDSETTVSVVYTDRDGEPVDNGRVTFEITGDDGGARVAEPTVFTASDGGASVVIRSGSATTFRVVASALGTDGDQVQINVTEGTVETLRVIPDYSGERRIGDIDVGLFTNFRCSEFAGSVPSPRDVETTRAGDAVTFERVDTATPTSVYALGYTSDGAVAAFRCADVDFSAGDITMQLQDVIRIDGGTFEMTETFDVTEANGVLNFVLGAATGLTTDPADWLIDLALDSGILPGVAEDLLRDSRSLIGGFINDAIKDLNRPDYIDDLLEAGAELDRVFTELTLAGTLSVPEPDEFGNAEAIHRLREIRVPVGDEIITRALTGQRVDGVMVTFDGPNQTIAPHTFDNIPFGEVIGIALNEVVLPRLPDSPRSITEVLENLINCEGLAASLADAVDEEGSPINEVVADVTEDACEAGVSWAGSQIEDQITGLLDYESLTLSGMGRSTDGNVDFQADAFEGTADAIWSGGPGSDLEFSGTLVGDREGEATERVVDRVAERFAAAR